MPDSEQYFRDMIRGRAKSLTNRQIDSYVEGRFQIIRHAKEFVAMTVQMTDGHKYLGWSLENVQNIFKNIEIGSYPFFRQGKIGVSIVIRSTEKKKIDECYKQIVSFLKKKRIRIIER